MQASITVSDLVQCPSVSCNTFHFTPVIESLSVSLCGNCSSHQWVVTFLPKTMTTKVTWPILPNILIGYGPWQYCQQWLILGKWTCQSLSIIEYITHKLGSVFLQPLIPQPIQSYSHELSWLSIITEFHEAKHVHSQFASWITRVIMSVVNITGLQQAQHVEGVHYNQAFHVFPEILPSLLSHPSASIHHHAPVDYLCTESPLASWKPTWVEGVQSDVEQ